MVFFSPVPTDSDKKSFITVFFRLHCHFHFTLLPPNKQTCQQQQQQQQTTNLSSKQAKEEAITMGKVSTHDHNIRARLLNRLGIYQGLPVRQGGPSSCYSRTLQSQQHATPTISSSNPTTVGVMRDNIVTFETTLKDNNDNNDNGGSGDQAFFSFWSSNPPQHYEPLQTPSCQQTPTTPNTNTTSKHIHFDSTVTVVHIPSHSQYSQRIKKCLWSSPFEIEENAQRNIREFQSEGWDWHCVLEDEQFLQDAQGDRTVHPCWFPQEDQRNEDDANHHEWEESEFSSTAPSNNDNDNVLELERPTLTRTSCVFEGMDDMSDE
jgi:hypothetical protein